MIIAGEREDNAECTAALSEENRLCDERLSGSINTCDGRVGDVAIRLDECFDKILRIQEVIDDGIEDETPNADLETP